MKTIIIILIVWAVLIVLFIKGWQNFRKNMPNDIDIMDREGEK